MNGKRRALMVFLAEHATDGDYAKACEQMLALDRVIGVEAVTEPTTDELVALARGLTQSLRSFHAEVENLAPAPDEPTR